MKQLPSVNSELDDELIDKIFKNHFDILSPFLVAIDAANLKAFSFESTS